MNRTTRNQDPEVPVVCSLCATRMYASAAQVGTIIRCPDCQTGNLVRPPVVKPPPAKPKWTGDEYRLAEDQPRSEAASVQYVRLTCTTCFLLMNARVEHVGRKVRCPDCDTVNLVPRPPAGKQTYHMPDVTDVRLEEAPPPKVDLKRQATADRLMKAARAEVVKKESTKPRPPKTPFGDGVYSFPFQWDVLPIWVGMAVAFYLIWTLVNVINDLMAELSIASVLAVFVTILCTAVVLGTAGAVCPALLHIVEFTADGHRRAPYWPSHDLLDRMRSIFLFFNSFAVSIGPWVVLLSVLAQALPIPVWLGVPMGLVFWPIVLLSMFDSNSIFIPFTSGIRDTLSDSKRGYGRFYIHYVFNLLAVIVVAEIGWLIQPRLGICLLGIGIAWFLVLFFRLLGRLAWLIGVSVPDEVDAT